MFGSEAREGLLPVSGNRLNVISTTLKRGQTVISKVMDLILTMLGCITLQVDHRSYLYDFKDIFSEKRLRTLRSDLRNLRDFNGMFFNYLVAELLVEALKTEESYQKKKNTNSSYEPLREHCKRVILRRKVRAVVKFLIFRKLRWSPSFNPDSEVRRWVFYKELIDVILYNQINRSFVLDKSKSVIKYVLKNDNQKNLVNSKANVNRKTENTRDDGNVIKLSEKKEESCNGLKYICVGHVCKRIYCPICYGWLWIPLYYCCMFLYPITISIAQTLVNEFIIP